MKIAICSSLDFSRDIIEIEEKLKDLGHQVTIPYSTKLIKKGEITAGDIKKEKESGEIVKRTIRQDSFRYYYRMIKQADAILVLNIEKKGRAGYIGGAVFLEMGFAHVLDKKIFLLNDIPEMGYTDEIKGMQTVIIDGDLEKIK